ncbi:aspartate/glutamate racemase family protein [Yoonia sediminilitoris]|uniref:Asp/Glu/hydantoin racemase n=1 Tax=Yoonia sediminilitoris TaxID=1286148 RepID=A0A2T6KMN9_9RHOB|nr:aspartate/glutamate racemase family protein [Yoonia sediminilitoris]PUB17441.1 Asp/Glu/hydantoin racemase [Yoonia sediminilitoris]RCW97736.1 Asp/Glu/hydantoin racemase [Yoonia sediminilitoris]
MTQTPKPRVLLMNPNSNAATTQAMVTIAAHVLPSLASWTAPAGPSLISTMDDLNAAATLVATARIPNDIDGVIVSAFGDPGRKALAERLEIPVVGIGEAAAIAAAKGGRRYAVVTHTPGLVTSIDALMRASAPQSAYLGTFLADADPLAVSADKARLDAALLAATHRAYAAGAQAVIIGGGPLAEAAERLRLQAPCDLIMPIPEAARRILAQLKDPT